MLSKMVFREAALLLLLIVDISSGQTCYKNTTSYTCESLGNTTSCLGATLTFTQTSLEFADSSTLSSVNEKLKLWEGLKYVPECWSLVQPFLCSVYLPKCEVGKVELPSKELCKKIKSPCKIVEIYHGAWPDFLDCDESHFVTGCPSQAYDSLEFNTDGSCISPLVRTEDSESWYDYAEGCGVQCQNPLYTDKEHDQVHAIIAVFGSICLVCTLFTVLTFLIDWKNSKKYPALILFFINICFFLSSIGWMAQFSGGARTDIVCKSDGTIREGGPLTGETASCTFVFILVYYFFMAGAVWFVMLAYAWHLTFKALGTPRDDLSNKTSYFHLASWSIPLVLTIVSLAVSEIDGDSVSGICMIGYQNKGYRAGFLLVPIILVLILGMIFLVKAFKTLWALKVDTPDFISDKAKAKIKETIIRLAIFTALACVFVVITFSVHLYTFTNETEWEKHLKDYIFCQANVTVTTSVYNTSNRVCSLGDRPSVAAVNFHILAFFGAGILMSSWSWTKASLLSWERFVRKIFNRPSSKPVKLKKHKMIARAFERRKDINNGRLSISFGSTHDDPLGMKFDLNSVSSHEMSSTFANAMPKLVRRRGGMFAPTAGTNRRYSDSDVGSIASKMASRRQSLDSQLSEAQGQFQYSDDEDADQEYVDLPNMIGGGGGGAGVSDGRGKRRRKRKKKRKSHKNRVLPVLAPVTREMAAAAYGGRRRGKRRSSKSSLGSRASAQGVDINLEKNSMEAVSIASYSHQESCDNATMPLPPKSLTTNFAIFTASAYAGELKTKINDDSDNNSVRHNGSMRNHSSSRRTRNNSGTAQAGGRKRVHSNSMNSRQGSASSMQRRNPSIDMRSINSRHASASSFRQRNVSLEMNRNQRQGIASSSHHMNNTFEMKDSRTNRKANSASSRSSRGTRQSSATSNRSNLSASRQLPGETTVVQIDEDYISQGSLD
ncbi:smoothened homolog [Mytilus californianus]|uniref:smoothened homolog n=1 Tax=Mytilus californianus TaxID=6549 RepID=UPI0022450DB7|nr:smoothened homolog [Mytilus californianus]